MRLLLVPDSRVLCIDRRLGRPTRPAGWRQCANAMQVALRHALRRHRIRAPATHAAFPAGPLARGATCTSGLDAGATVPRPTRRSSDQAPKRPIDGLPVAPTEKHGVNEQRVEVVQIAT